MAETTEKQEGFLKRIRPHAEWEGIRWGWELIRSLLIPASWGLAETIRHVSVDWLGLSILAALCFLIGYSVFPSKRTRMPSKHTYKLRIKSAEWGAGKSFGSVKNCLEERATDALIARVDADLFHGYDPASGILKQLTVVYSFGEDPTEYKVIRNQHDLLVLPQSPEGLDSRFTPLQINALTLAREIREFISGFEPLPPQTEDASFVNARGKWSERLRSQYQIKFKKRLEAVLLEFQAINIRPDPSFITRGVARANIEKLAEADALVAMAHKVDDVELKGTYNT